MKLRVIIVSYNTRDRLRQCLRAVYGSQTQIDFVVWVVDNASADGSADMVATEFPQATLLRNSENVGYAKANNLALRQGTKQPEYFLLLNPDTEISPETFDKMIQYLDNNSDVGIAGCKIVKSDGSLDLASRRSFPNPANALFRFSGLSFLFPQSRLASYNLTYLPDNQITDVDSVMGAFLLIRAETVAKIGLLDEDFFMYGEDLDWCYRAKAIGYKVRYVPITTVVHHKGSSSLKVPDRALYEFHRAMQIFYDKHYSQKHNFIFNFLVALGIWLLYAWKFLKNSFSQKKYVSK